MQFDAAWPHEVDVGLGGGVAVFEGAFFFCFGPEYLIVTVGIEGRVDVNEVDALIREFL